MKFLFQILAALLLWIFIACNNRSATSNNKADTSKGVMVQEELADAELAPPPTSAPAIPDSKFTPPQIVKDGEVKEEEKPAEFNTEDYDHIVENKFLAVTNNPL